LDDEILYWKGFFVLAENVVFSFQVNALLQDVEDTGMEVAISQLLYILI